MQGKSPLTGPDAFPTNLTDRNLTFGFDGQGSVIIVGSLFSITLPYACTILEWTALSLLAESGSLTFDLWKDSYANHAPTVADTIIGGGGTKPNITTAIKGQSSTLTGWTPTLAVGDILTCRVDSVTTITLAALFLKVRVTT